MYKVMTDGLCHSRHRTRLEAMSEIERHALQTRKQIRDHMDEMDELQEYQNSLIVEREEADKWR